MTKNQKTKLAAQVSTFIMAFSMFTVLIPYAVVILAVYYSVQLARRI